MQGMQNAISVDGADYATSWDSAYAANYPTRNAVFWIGTLASGSHTIKGRVASNTGGSTVTISNRVLVIYILDGDTFLYLDNSAASTAPNTTIIDDPQASFTFTPTGSCKALILYNISNSGVTESAQGKKAAISIGGITYSQAEKSPGTTNYADSVSTLWASSLSASSTTVKGRFASNAAATVTISRRQLGVLLFADTTLLDYVSSDTQVSTTLSSLQDDGQATIPRTTADARELLVAAMGTKRSGTSSNNYGECYGIKVDSNDRTNSRGSASAGATSADSAATAWAENLAAGSHTIQGRFSNNNTTETAVISSRRIAALWLVAPLPAAPVATAATNIQLTSFSANWNASSGATGYRLDVSTDSGFGSFVTGYSNLDVGNVLTYSVSSNVSLGTTYYYRVRAYNANGTSGNSNVINLTTACGVGTIVNTGNATSNNTGTAASITHGLTINSGDVVVASIEADGTTGGPLAVDVVASQKCQSCTSLSWTHNGAASPSNYLVIVDVVGEGNNIAISTVTYGGQAMTQIVNRGDGNAAPHVGRVYQYGLINPPTGSQTVTATFAGSMDNIFGGSITFTGANQTTGWHNATSTSATSGTTANLNVTSAVGEMTATVAEWQQQPSPPTTNQTPRWGLGNNGLGDQNVAAGDTAAGAATVTHTWTSGNDTHAVAGCSIMPAVSSTITDNNGANAFTQAIQENSPASGATMRYAIYYRVAGASEPSSYAWTLASSQLWSIVIRVFSGVDTTSVWDVAPSTSTRTGSSVNGTTATAPSMTTASAGAMGIAAFFTDAAATIYSAPTNGYGTLVQPGASRAQASAIRTWDTAGATGTTSATLSASGDWTAHQVALKPAVLFSGCPPPAPVATAATNITATSFSANWNASSGADGYLLDVATDSGFTSFVQGYQDLDVGAVLTYSVANWPIGPGTTYYYRVRAYNTDGTSGNSNTITVTTPDALTLGNHTLWQVTNRFTTTSPVTNVLFRFNLRRSTATTVTAVRVHFTTDAGVVDGDVTAGALYRDTNNNGEIDGGDLVLATGVAGSGGQLAFAVSEDPGTGGTHYLVRATVANLIVGDSSTFSVTTADVDSSLLEIGSISSATHTRLSVTALYRSVGTTATALASGTSNGLTISGSTATFDSGLPNNIGVGDVIQYDSDTNGTIDALAFIHGRTSSTVFTVKNKNGGTPTATQAKDNDWAIYRAYTSLANWESQNENANISEPTENDVNPSLDLVTADTQLNVACYGDGEDATSVVINSWTTGPTNYIRIYTPVSQSEVGASQRHSGTWSTSAYRISMDGSYFAPIGIFDRYVRIEGLQIDSKLQVSGQSNGIQVDDGHLDAAVEIQISNCIFRMSAAPPATQAYGIGILNNFVGSNSNYIAKVWNNIIYGYTAASGSQGLCMYAQDNGTVYAYNNSCVGVGPAATAKGISASGSVVFYAKNNISIDSTDPYVGSFHTDSTNNLSDTGDAPGSNPKNAEPTFVNKAGNDYHLALSDTGAKDQGTSLSSDAYLPFSVDIEGQSRPFGSAWDIGADEYQTGLFGYRRQITISDATTPSSCTSDLSDFPVLVKVTDVSLRSAANGGHVESPNGYDIIFRALDGTTQLDHEIEKYVATTGELVAWVRIPTLVYNADTTIYMYYGNSGVTTPTANPAGVWDTGYKGVWHLKESGSGMGSEYDDSTQYANEGQGGRGNPLYVPHQTVGQIGYGQDFNNSDGKYDLVDVGNGSALNITGNQITLEAWVRHNLSSYAHESWGFVNRKGWDYGYRLLMQTSGFGCAPLCVHFGLGGGGTFVGTNTLLTAGTWHHVVGTYDGSLMRVFIDGVQDANTLVNTDNLTSPLPPEDHVWIGHGDQPTDVGWSSEWDGQIDEVRISNVARSACWIQTEYTNQGTPTDVDLGGEQVVDSTYLYHQAITIANAMTPASCTSNLANFPVLIDTTNWATADKNALRTVANGGHVQSPTYYDLIFRDTAGLQLDHEIESYNATNGTLVAWVRIPSLNPSGDTTIYMYYGNSSITSPTANPAGVWNST